MSTLGVMAADVAAEIGMSSTAGTAERSQIDGWLNEAVVEFLRETKCHVKVFGCNLTAGVGDYELPMQILSMKDVGVLSSGSQTVSFMEPVSGRDMSLKRLGATTAVGSGPPTAYALEGANLFQIYPVAASSSDVIIGKYVPRPTAMSADTHDPSDPTYGGVPAEYHPALTIYAMSQAASWDDDASSKVGQSYAADWEKRLAAAKGHFLRKAGVRLAPARPGGKRRATVGRGVDTPYWA